MRNEMRMLCGLRRSYKRERGGSIESEPPAFHQRLVENPELSGRSKNILGWSGKNLTSSDRNFTCHGIFIFFPAFFSQRNFNDSFNEETTSQQLLWIRFKDFSEARILQYLRKFLKVFFNKVDKLKIRDEKYFFKLQIDLVVLQITSRCLRWNVCISQEENSLITGRVLHPSIVVQLLKLNKSTVYKLSIIEWGFRFSIARDSV